MNTISQITRKMATVVAMMTLMLASACTKEVGEVGPKGDKGDTGAQGQTGNADVQQITFGSQTWANTIGASVTLTLDGINPAMADKSAFFTYLKTVGTGIRCRGKLAQPVNFARS